MPLTGELTRNPGMRYDRESNWQPFALQVDAQPIEPYRPGLIFNKNDRKQNIAEY